MRRRASTKTGEETDDEQRPVTHVLVLDQTLEMNSMTGTDGVDIYRLSVTRGSTVDWAFQTWCKDGLGDNSGADTCGKAAGEPHPNPCSVQTSERWFFSLGAAGGYFIGSFGNTLRDEFEVGDTITVYECFGA